MKHLETRRTQRGADTHAVLVLAGQSVGVLCGRRITVKSLHPAPIADVPTCACCATRRAKLETFWREWGIFPSYAGGSHFTH